MPLGCFRKYAPPLSARRDSLKEWVAAVGKLAAVAGALGLVPALAWGQVCTASLNVSPGSRWASVPLPADGRPAARLKVFAHLRCTTCYPDVSLTLTAGSATPALQQMPIGRKVGLDWARAVFDNPASREGFRQSVLRSELQSSPSCTIQGRVTGVREIGNLGTIGTAIEAECAVGSRKLAGEIYSAYDYDCEYQVQVIWEPALQPLLPTGRAEVEALLRNVNFGSK